METNKIPTAEEFVGKLDQKLKGDIRLGDIEKLMIEFAKMHVEKAIAAIQEANKVASNPRHGYITWNEIKNAYPLENIK